MTPLKSKAEQEDHDLLIVIEEIVKRIENSVTALKDCQDVDSRRIDDLEKRKAVSDTVLAQLRTDIGADVKSKNWTAGIVTLIASIIASLFGVSFKP
jgi:hypothetical protein